MRITKYNTILNADRLPVLVKEFSKKLFGRTAIK